MRRKISLFTALCLLLTLLTGVTAVCAGAEGTGVYQVLVTDTEDAPVSGVMVQFCSDTECMMGKTDDEGLAAFDQPAGTYTVHILKVPEGFAADSTEYTAPETPGLLTVVLSPEAAAEAEESAEEENVIDAPAAGFHFEYPESYQDLKGTLNWDAAYPGDGVLEITAEYYAVPEDQFDAYCEYAEAFIDAWGNGEEPPEAPVASWMSGNEYAWLFNIYTINGGRGEEELREILKDTSSREGDFAWLEEIGKDGDNTFFVGQYNQLEEETADYQEAMGDFYEEFASLAADRETFLSALTMSAPEWPEELSVGDVISFETTDLDGNPVTSGDLFARHKMTMINVWATWCSPCKNELPELAQMAEKFEEKDSQIIGLCYDSAEEGKTAEAKEILEQAGVKYLNLAAPENVDDVFPMSAFPTSFFVDSEGKILVEPVIGADLEGYQAALKEALALVEE